MKKQIRLWCFYMNSSPIGKKLESDVLTNKVVPLAKDPENKDVEKVMERAFPSGVGESIKDLVYTPLPSDKNLKDRVSIESSTGNSSISQDSFEGMREALFKAGQA